MQTLEVVYSPICEATGAMIGKLKQWLAGTDISITIYPYHLCPQRLREKLKRDENCFIDVFYQGERIDSVPLHQDRIYAALGIPMENKKILSFHLLLQMSSWPRYIKQVKYSFTQSARRITPRK